MFFLYKASEKATGMTACGSSQMPLTKRHNLPLNSNAYNPYRVCYYLLFHLFAEEGMTISVTPSYKLYRDMAEE